MLCRQRVDQFAQRFAGDHLRQLVECEVDAVIGDAALREIIGADALGAVAGADLLAAVDALHARATLGEAEFRALSAHYDDAKIFEIILLCGFYRTVAYLANALALPLEERVARFPVAVAQ